MKKMILLFSLSVTVLMAYSQEKPDRMHTAYFRLQAKIGLAFIDMDELNNVLKQTGFDPFEGFRHDEYSLVVKRPYRKWGSTFSYTDFQATNNGEHRADPLTNTSRNRTLRGSGLKMGIDYYILDRAFLKLYIPASIHWTKLRLHTFENIPPILQLSNSDDIDKDKFTSWRTSGEIGLNFETGIPLKELIISLGINGGYRIEIGDKGWKYENEISAGFPTFENQGFVFGLTFGLNAIRYRPMKPQM
jgi:hypothetical protein